MAIETLAKERKTSMSALCREAVAKDIGYDLQAEADRNLQSKDLDSQDGDVGEESRSDDASPVVVRKRQVSEARRKRRERTSDQLNKLRALLGLPPDTSAEDAVQAGQAVLAAIEAGEPSPEM